MQLPFRTIGMGTVTTMSAGNISSSYLVSQEVRELVNRVCVFVRFPVSGGCEKISSSSVTSQTTAYPIAPAAPAPAPDLL